MDQLIFGVNNQGVQRPSQSLQLTSSSTASAAVVCSSNSGSVVFSSQTIATNGTLSATLDISSLSANGSILISEFCNVANSQNLILSYVLVGKIFTVTVTNTSGASTVVLGTGAAALTLNYQIL